MTYKYMRLVLFFDLPVVKAKQRSDAQKFVRELKKLGFYMLQESVYVKMNVDTYHNDATLKKIEGIKPKEGSIFALSVTEKQFNSMAIILGEAISDVITTDDRLLEL